MNNLIKIVLIIILLFLIFNSSCLKLKEGFGKKNKNKVLKKNVKN